MLGIYDSAECPLDFGGNPLQRGTSPFFGAMPDCHGPRYPLESDTRELVKPNADGKVYAREQRLRVNKASHRIKFEDETENEVTVVIEPKP